MWISKKQLRDLLVKKFNDGRWSATLEAERSSHSYWIARNTAILHVVMPELKELEANTWDKNRIEKIRKILIQGLLS